MTFSSHDVVLTPVQELLGGLASERRDCIVYLLSHLPDHSVLSYEA